MGAGAWSVIKNAHPHCWPGSQFATQALGSMDRRVRGGEEECEDYHLSKCQILSRSNSIPWGNCSKSISGGARGPLFPTLCSSCVEGVNYLLSLQART